MLHSFEANVPSQRTPRIAGLRVGREWDELKLRFTWKYLGSLYWALGVRRCGKERAVISGDFRGLLSETEGASATLVSMENDTSLLSVFRRALDDSGFQAVFPPEVDLEQGMQELKLAAAKLGLEAYETEVRGVPLSTAVTDERNFPILFRLHVGIRDLLTLELPKELLSWAERLTGTNHQAGSDELQLQLGRMATDLKQPPTERALARLALFELLRMGLYLAEYLEKGSLAALGMRQCDFDELAEKQLVRWLELAPGLTADIRPLNIMMGAAMEELTAEGEIVQELFMTLNADLVTHAKLRQEFEAKLQAMNTPDALLIRNAVAGEGLLDDEQYVSLETLQAQHPLALGGFKRNTLDQRLKRLKERAVDGKLPERKSPALVDLVVKQLPERNS